MTQKRLRPNWLYTTKVVRSSKCGAVRPPRFRCALLTRRGGWMPAAGSSCRRQYLVEKRCCWRPLRSAPSSTAFDECHTDAYVQNSATLPRHPAPYSVCGAAKVAGNYWKRTSWIKMYENDDIIMTLWISYTKNRFKYFRFTSLWWTLTLIPYLTHNWPTELLYFPDKI